MKKSYSLLLSLLFCLFFIFPAQSEAQVNVCLDDDGSTLTFRFIPEVDYNVPFSTNLWFSVTMNLRYLDSDSVTFSNFQDLSPFGLSAATGPNNSGYPDFGYRYVIFSNVASGFIQFSMNQNDTIDIMSIDYTIESGGQPIFEVDTTNNSISGSFGTLGIEPFIQNFLLGDQYGGTVSCIGPFPVSILDFSGQSYNGGALLDWSTSLEVNSDYFVVQRSEDGNSFNVVGKVDASGNSNSLKEYQFFDQTPLSGRVYYRLLQLDLDGTSSESDIIEVNLQEMTNTGFSIYPNPGSDFVMIDEVYTSPDNPLTVFVQDMKGQTVLVEEFPEGALSYKLNTQNLSQGVYTITLQAKSGASFDRMKWIKE